MQRLMIAVVAAVVLAGAAPVAAQDKKGATVGMLRCNEASGWGLVFGSTRDLKCVFTGDKGTPSIRLTGKISKFGVDLGFKENAVILWGVVSTSDKFAPGQLAGKYVGVTAEVGWAVGLGANVLVGGSNKGFALQPISVSASNGINLAAGVAEVELQAAK